MNVPNIWIPATEFLRPDGDRSAAVWFMHERRPDLTLAQCETELRAAALAMVTA